MFMTPRGPLLPNVKSSRSSERVAYSLSLPLGVASAEVGVALTWKLM